ncbi:MAG: DUF488 family protein [Candidatus Komeilibacteria bacterium]
MIKTKSIHDPIEPDDGLRLFISSYWPKKSCGPIDLWFPELGSELELVKNWGLEKIDWQIFTAKYLEQLKQPELQSLLRTVADQSKKQTITLLGHAKQDDLCHRSILKSIFVVIKQKYF